MIARARELMMKAAKDEAPASYLRTIAQCSIFSEVDGQIECNGPDWDPALMAHSIGILSGQSTTVGPVTHNPWAIGICCTQLNAVPTEEA